MTGSMTDLDIFLPLQFSDHIQLAVSLSSELFTSGSVSKCQLVNIINIAGYQRI